MIQNSYWKFPTTEQGKILEHVRMGAESIKRLKKRVLEIDAAPEPDAVIVHLRIQAITRIDVNVLSKKVITSLAQRCHLPLDQVVLVSVDTEPTNRNLTKETGRTPMTVRSSAA